MAGEYKVFATYETLHNDLAKLGETALHIKDERDALLAIAQRCEDYFNSSVNGVPLREPKEFMAENLLRDLRAAISKATGGRE